MNPPVDAPASRAWRPRTSTANASSAASSFSPPRLTNRAGGPPATTASRGVDEPGRLVRDRAVDQHAVQVDQPDGLGAAGDEPAPHQLRVEPGSTGHRDQPVGPALGGSPRPPGRPHQLGERPLRRCRGRVGELRPGLEEPLQRVGHHARRVYRPGPTGSGLTHPPTSRQRDAIAARSSAARSGCGSVAAPRSVTPDQTSAKRQPSVRANRPSVSGRSPTITAAAARSAPTTSRTSRGHRLVRLARDHRLDPAGDRHRGEDRAAAGDRPVGRRVGRVVVRADAAGRRGAPPSPPGAGRRSRSRGGSRRPRRRTARIERSPRRTGRVLQRGVRTRWRRALDRLHDARSARRPAPARPGRTSCAAASAEVSTSPAAGMPIAPSASSCRSIGAARVVGDEQHPVTGAAQARRSPRREPAIGCRASHTTPSRSQQHDAVRRRAAARAGRVGISPCWHGGWQPVAVPRFEPFRALRYAADLPLDDVTAPPYDVLVDRRRRRRWSRAHPRNIVARRRARPGRRTRTATTTPPHRLRAWLAEGTLVVDDAPDVHALPDALHRRRTAAARETVGVIGALEVVDEGAGGVLPHERTTPKAKTDRLDLTRATEANLSPVWGLSLAAGSHASCWHEPGEPVGVVHRRARRGAHRRAGRRPGAGRGDRGSRSASTPVLIADGHHRYAISRTYRDERRAADGAGTVGPDPGLRRRAGRGPAEHRRDPPRLHRRTSPEALLAAFADALRAGAGRTGRRGASPPRSSAAARCASCTRTAPAPGCPAPGAVRRRARPRRRAARARPRAAVDVDVSATSTA